MRSPFSSVLFVTVILVSSTFASTTLSVNNTVFITGPLSGTWFDYVIVIMMENHSINNTYDNGHHSCLGNCTYYTSLANSNGLAEEYTIGGAQNPSIGAYIAITSGYGNTPADCNSFPPGDARCPLLQIPSIVDRLENKGLSWKAYMEGYPDLPGCYNNDIGNPNNYHFNHNPFIYYANIQNDATRCSHIVNANSQRVSQTGCGTTAIPNDNLFINDLNSPSTAPNYMFLTPNTIDDAHDCNDVSASNAWLNRLVPQILNSALFKTKKAALFITFDEKDCTFPGCPSPAIPELYTVWASNSTNPTTMAGFKSVKPYTLYSTLRTVEDNWNLQPLIASTDGSANNMAEFLRARS